MKYIYIISCQEYYKIGISNDVNKRTDDLQIGNPFELKVIDMILVEKPSSYESLIHMKLKDYHVRGEWFNASIHEIRKVIDEVTSIEPDLISHKEKTEVMLGGECNNPRRQKRIKKMIKRDNAKGHVEVDDDVLRQIMTKGCGIPKWKAQLLGLRYPPKRGWMKRIIGRTISISAYNLLIQESKP